MDNNKETEKMLSIFGIIIVVWLALLVAPYTNNGLRSIFENISIITNSPFKIIWNENSLKTIFIFLLIYGITIGYYFTSKKNYRNGEEHGSAKWGNPLEINNKYIQKPLFNNKILTQNVKLGLNGKKHRRNLNVLVCGGSGAGKTRFYCKPNIMQANSSFIVLDPKGEILRDTGNLLIKKGYKIKVLDLINMEKSHCYNPFVYLKNDSDVQKLVTNFFKSTNPNKNASSQDPFWGATCCSLKRTA